MVQSMLKYLQLLKVVSIKVQSFTYFRFIDSRKFATCSDDSTVCLWDARNLKSRLRVLQGHSNWVKNIEYSHKDKLLLTSGFDGVIYTWELDK